MEPVTWLDNKLRILDQTRLPHQIVHLDMTDYHEVIIAIKELKVRGAPAIGVAAGYGIALASLGIIADTSEEYLNKLVPIFDEFASSRPTAVNLFHAVNRMKAAAQTAKDIAGIKKALIAEAKNIHQEEIEGTSKLSHFGAELIEDGFTILTHCNAGPLATAGFGTALGVILAARDAGKKVKVYSDETRPLLQGARLTAWEMVQEKISVTLITDSMAGYFLHRGEIDCVIVGADRIARNGDTANKIGTYSVAVLAKENNVPFYVASPTSTIDLTLKSGKDIPIEQRKPEEVTHFAGVCVAAAGAKIANPAFDVTPYRYITAIITENGIVNKPYLGKLSKIVKR